MKKLLATLFFLGLVSSAQAQIIGSLPFILQNGTTADASQVMADYNFIIAAVNANVAKNGVNSDITQLTALTSITSPITFGSNVTINGSLTVGGILINSAIPATKTGAYTVLTTDCGSTIPLGGNVQFLLTIPSPSTFPANCQINITNVDQFPSGRGKRISISGVYFPLQVLYPGMSFIASNVNGQWQMLNLPLRWRPPGSSVVNFYTDFINGLDRNDGLQTGAGNAKKTDQACLDTIANDLDLSAWSGNTGEPSGQGQAVCNQLAGSTDTQGIHWSPKALLGAQGGASVLLQGNGGAATIHTTGADAAAFFLNASLQIQNLTLISDSGSDLSAGYASDVETLLGMTYGASGGAQISTTDHATIRLSKSYTVTGGGTQHYLAQGQSAITTQGLTITVTGGAFAYSAPFANAANSGQILVNGATFSGFAGTTGQRYNASGLGSILTTTGSATFFPGNAGGTVNCTTAGNSIGICGMYN